MEMNTRACVAVGAAIVLLSVGCASQPVPVEVKVAVPVPCDVATPARPRLPVDDLAEGASLFERVRALIASFERLNAHVIKLESALAGCKSPGPAAAH